MAVHAATGATQVYDRREDRVTLDQVVKINIQLPPAHFRGFSCRIFSVFAIVGKWHFKKWITKLGATSTDRT
jgi:hypothetical protein